MPMAAPVLRLASLTASLLTASVDVVVEAVVDGFDVGVTEVDSDEDEGEDVALEDIEEVV